MLCLCFAVFRSGPTAFMDNDVAYMLKVDSIVKTVPDKFGWSTYFNDQSWAQPDVTNLKYLMLHVFSNPQEARHKGAAARRHIVQHYSSEVVATKIAAEIERIESILKDRKQLHCEEGLAQRFNTQKHRKYYDGACNRLPGGSYLGTCVSCSLSKAKVLECDCQDALGRYHHAKLDYSVCGTSDVQNDDAKLTC